MSLWSQHWLVHLFETIFYVLVNDCDSPSMKRSPLQSGKPKVSSIRQCNFGLPLESELRTSEENIMMYQDNIKHPHTTWVSGMNLKKSLIDHLHHDA